jgi:hypothetical protein
MRVCGGVKVKFNPERITIDNLYEFLDQYESWLSDGNRGETPEESIRHFMEYLLCEAYTVRRDRGGSREL